jgi:hypothetical protein
MVSNIQPVTITIPAWLVKIAIILGNILLTFASIAIITIFVKAVWYAF